MCMSTDKMLINQINFKFHFLAGNGQILSFHLCMCIHTYAYIHTHSTTSLSD